MATFRVADASEYLAITGWGIHDVKLAKKAWVFAGQQCKRFSISPVNYEFEVHAMSAEKLPFILPAVFTIGPRITATGAEESDRKDLEAQLLLYAKLIAPLHSSRSHVHELVKGIIEGETRVLAAELTMEEIFKGTKSFKEKVFTQVQLELNQFGLIIYNANVKQLVDVPGHEYFSYLGQKTQQDAANQAKVDVAEARMKGEVGAKEREGLTRQNAAKVDAETKVLSVRQVGQGLKEEAKVKAEVQVFENAREADIAAAKAELAMKKAGWDKQAKVAEVEASKAVAIRDAELQMEVERKNALRLTEKLKAEQLSKATVQYETQVQDSNAQLYSRQKAAEAALFEQMRTAEARKAQADAHFFEQKMSEDAKLYAKQKESESVALLGRAKTEYVASMLQALGGNYYALRDYLMIDGGMYPEMARINAGAVNGMQPKISIWTNAGGADGAANAGAEAAAGSALQQVAGVYKMLPPLLSTVHEQTGMLPPAWMGALPKDGAAK
ncbi:flotillin-like protein 2 [Lolium perenne]|uniref:flotillin-like protein 2 n=1 Tax=Lolium perenne TaxID=4522 RepID=UPI0021EB226A|nr:flotillin-like protein 2 [Lolium perenne]